ncbi:MarR family transcriptional regulator [Streptomyces pluripotens]|uniref:MarR family transcriptional regulator n=1 Tax=Streptomyces pluripotens TaxID=1355015 RepID=A0A221P3Z4_9ACTN|nr:MULTISPECIES: MarR family transcriptional regulator [Streptomyces]ARP72677.1 MarR family transcriptional regulator [Streptomyces pluripotens]ASN26930.1 MarR family transcriptional regulator [Streptomyces pluripotens]KIE26643.1 MarR family transcriptional regulator [Streptomyces sp. MUSC 125]MCH0558795.1 MarR family transcriptional regulator [Streptomyces sp. MUM 16J]
MSDALEVSLRLVRAQTALVRRFDARLSGLHGVSLADFTLLLKLGRAPGGRMRRVDLAEALGLTASGVTRGLVPLERIGLVTREPDARDARVAYAALTRTGRERLTEMLATAEETAAELFAGPGWSEADVALFSGLLARLGGTGLPSPLPR